MGEYCHLVSVDQIQRKSCPPSATASDGFVTLSGRVAQSNINVKNKMFSGGHKDGFSFN